MKKLPVLYYRKLKKNPKVWIISLQQYATLDLSEETNVFVGITQYSTAFGHNTYFGYLETMRISAKANDCEIELLDDCFEDDKKYTEKEVEKILHPLLLFITPELDVPNTAKNNQNGENISTQKLLKICKEIYKKTLGYSLESIKINSDGSTSHLHSDRFLDEHPERKNSPEFTKEEETEQMKQMQKIAQKLIKEQ